MKIIQTESIVMDFLRKESLGILGTRETNTDFIRQRVMYYGIDDKFNCYLMSTKGSPKIAQVQYSSQVSFIIYTIEDPYDESWEIEIDGLAELLTDKKEINFALDKLKGNNPFADVVIESDIVDQFDFVKLTPEIIRFRIYGEALSGNPPAIIKF